jgi:hypothetical protein
MLAARRRGGPPAAAMGATPKPSEPTLACLIRAWASQLSPYGRASWMAPRTVSRVHRFLTERVSQWHTKRVQVGKSAWEEGG